MCIIAYWCWTQSWSTRTAWFTCMYTVCTRYPRPMGTNLEILVKLALNCKNYAYQNKVKFIRTCNAISAKLGSLNDPYTSTHLIKSNCSSILVYGAVQLLRNALGGGSAMVWHFVTGERGSAERCVTPKIIYMKIAAKHAQYLSSHGAIYAMVHRIVSKEGSIVFVSRVFWYMELKPGQWRLMICHESFSCWESV